MENRNRVIITFFIMCVLMLTSTLPLIEDNNVNGDWVYSNASDEKVLGSSNSHPTKVSVADSPWPMICGNVKHTGLSKYNTSDNPGKIKATYDFNVQSRQPLIGTDGTIFLAGYDGGGFKAIWPNGTQRWSNQYHSQYYPVLGSDGVIYHVTNSGLKAFYSSNGTIKWSNGSKAISSPLIDNNGILYFMTLISYKDIEFNAIHTNGTEKWNISLERNTIGGLGRTIISPTMDDEGIIYINSPAKKTNSTLYAIYPNGTIKWRFDRSYTEIASPAIGSDGTVYTADKNGLIALYPDNGSIKWNISDNYRDYTSVPVIGPDGTIYWDGFFNLKALTPDGKLKWKRDFEYSSMSIPTIGSEGTIYFSLYNKFFAINPDGSLKWNRMFDDAIKTSSGVINSNGDIYLSGSKLFVLGKIPPTPLTDLILKSGDSFVNISWSPPEDNGGAEIIEYRIFKGTSSGKTELFATLDEGTLHFNDSSVVNGNLYYYNMTAVNSVGESESTGELSAMPLVIPTSPRNASVAVTEFYISLEWDPPSDDGGTHVIAYDIYKGTYPEQMEYCKRVDEHRNSFEDRDVEIGQIYYYFVTASNTVGESEPSETVNGTYKTVPYSPRNLSMTSGNAFVHLEWQAPTQDGGSPIINYRVYRGFEETDVLLVELEPNNTHHNDTSVVNGVSYSYNVTAVTELGESKPSNQVLVTPMTIPSPPEDLMVGSGINCINLTWLPPGSTGGSRIRYFNLYRSGGTGEEVIIQVPESSGNIYNDTNVSNGVMYTYSISSVNGVGESDRTGPIQAMPRGFPFKPENLSIEFGPGFVHIYWDHPLSDEGAPVNAFRIFRNSSYYATVSEDTLDYNDTDVDNNVQYSYTVTAMNEIGESVRPDSVWGYPYLLPEIKEPPTSPLNFSFEVINDTVHFKWSPPVKDGGMQILGYKIYRSMKEDGGFTIITTLSSNSFNWTEGSILYDQEYFYYVTTYTSGFESGPSEKARVKLEWTPPDTNPQEKDNNWIFIVLSISTLFLILAGLGFFIVYRKGMRDPEDEELDEALIPAYDFETIGDHES